MNPKKMTKARTRHRNRYCSKCMWTCGPKACFWENAMGPEFDASRLPVVEWRSTGKVIGCPGRYELPVLELLGVP